MVKGTCRANIIAVERIDPKGSPISLHENCRLAEWYRKLRNRPTSECRRIRVGSRDQ